MKRWIPIVALALAAGLVAAEGRSTPEWVDKLGAAPWHRAGHKGRGVTVAVLDTGFRGLQTARERVLPTSVVWQSLRRDGNIESRDSSHGLLCAEVVHAIAPDAKLLLIDWQPGDRESFIAAVAAAKRAGARVLTCSVALPSWSDGAGGGPVHDAVGDIIGDNLLCIASAGNMANRHWSGKMTPDDAGWHRWPDGTLDNAITPFNDDAVSVELATRHGEFEIAVFDDARRCVAHSRVWGSAHVRFAPRSGRTYTVRVRGPADADFHLYVLNGWLGQWSAADSVPFPGDGPRWLTVGAWENGQRAPYSSCGGAGSKPDLAAEVPVPSRLRREPFGGTSAAAPQAAGIAALLLSRDPDLSASELKRLLRASARDVLAPGFDPETGAGLLRAPANAANR
jgi:subtilisin family serine protease